MTRVERTLLSAAFDVAFFHSKISSPTTSAQDLGSACETMASQPSL
jgi:hypothetical protein